MIPEMAKDPAFLFYPGDWLGGTLTFSRAHKGAYMDLLMAQYNAGHMALHDIREVLGQRDFDEMWESKLKSKFKADSEGKFYNEKLESEVLKRKKYTQGRLDNLSHVGSYIDSHVGDHVRSHSENENDNVNEYTVLNISFESFWDLYDKKVGEKAKLVKKWAALSDKDRVAIMEFIPKYKSAQPDKKFRKDPQGFLNQKKWLDEIIPSDNGTTQQSTPKDGGNKFSRGAQQLLGKVKNDLRRRGDGYSGG